MGHKWNSGCFCGQATEGPQVQFGGWSRREGNEDTRGSILQALDPQDTAALLLAHSPVLVRNCLEADANTGIRGPQLPRVPSLQGWFSARVVGPGLHSGPSHFSLVVRWGQGQGSMYPCVGMRSKPCEERPRFPTATLSPSQSQVPLLHLLSPKPPCSSMLTVALSPCTSAQLPHHCCGLSWAPQLSPISPLYPLEPGHPVPSLLTHHPPLAPLCKEGRMVTHPCSALGKNLTPNPQGCTSLAGQALLASPLRLCHSVGPRAPLPSGHHPVPLNPPRDSSCPGSFRYKDRHIPITGPQKTHVVEASAHKSYSPDPGLPWQCQEKR